MRHAELRALPARAFVVFAAAVALASCGGAASPSTASRACDPHAGALAAYTLQNLPGTIDVEYFAKLADGRTMPGPSTLTVGADTSELTVMTPGTRPTGAAFLCL
jgi:hypothetical protein